MGFLSGGGKTTTTQQRTLDPFQAQLLSAGRGRLDVATQDLNRLSQQATQRADVGLQAIERGELDPASRALLSQNVDRNRRLQAARQASLASQFGPGTALSNILGRQGALRSDLAQNAQSFAAFRDQIARQGQFQQGLQGLLGLRGAGVGGLLQSQAAQQRTAGLTSGITQTQEKDLGFLGTLGKIGDVAGKIGTGFSPTPIS